MAAPFCCLIVAALVPWQQDVPTEQAVRDAVENCIGLEPINEQARADLQRWGDDALPVLREMAEGFSDSAEDFHLLVAVTTLKTAGAADLMVSFIEREPIEGRGSALMLVANGPPLPHEVNHFRNHPRFRAAILAKTESRSARFRRYVASIIGRMGWDEELPTVEAMLDDPDLTVRREAAEAVKRLTGHVVDINEPDLVFPSTDTRGDLVRVLGTVQIGEEPASATAFASWGTQEHCLIYAPQHHTAVLISDKLDEWDELGIGSGMNNLLVLPAIDGTTQLIALDSHGEPSYGNGSAIAYTEDGQESWRFSYEERPIHSMAPLYRDGDPVGVVFATAFRPGVVATDLAGSEIWTTGFHHAVFQVHSHPDLDVVALCGTDVTIVDSIGSPIAGSPEFLQERFANNDDPNRVFARHAQLFPDDQGNPALVIAGKSVKSVPTIARQDVKGGTAWLATLPHEIRGLCQLDNPETGPVFVAATTGGEIVVFDAHGTLLSLQRIDESERGFNDEFRIYGLAAGRFGDKWAFAITTQSATTVYELKPPE